MRYLIYLLAAYLLSFVVCLLAYRLPREKNVIKYEAACPNCEEKTSWLRFIPFFGYIFSKGKYKCCDTKMSVSRLLIPIFLVGLTGLAVWLVGCDWAKFDLLFDGAKAAVIDRNLEVARILLALFSAVMLIVIFADFETMIIPDTCHVLIIILAILAMVFKFTDVLWGILGGVIFFIAFFAIARIAIRVTGNEDALGGGDIKLISVCGLFLGAGKCLLGLLIGSILAFVIEGVILKKKKKEQSIPFAFGPYLAIGMLIAAYFGNIILSAYENLIGI